ncbi:hypothetical protein CRUP_014910, partial [Coryphaenoides rupestris]
MDTLRKELEEELKLSTEDLRSHAWFHGPVSREGAETLLERDGDFLVRDSSSGAGDYVLSCYWRDEPMHFKIIRASGAIVFHPITRTLPIRVISERQAEQQGGSSGSASAGGGGGGVAVDRCKRRSFSSAAADLLHVNNPLL